MIDLKTFENLAGQPVGDFAAKPTTLTEGQEEASSLLWTSEDGRTKIGASGSVPQAISLPTVQRRASIATSSRAGRRSAVRMARARPATLVRATSWYCLRAGRASGSFMNTCASCS